MTSESEKKYKQASIATADNLKTMAHTLMARELSHLTLPQIDEAVDIVSRMVPAGNVPGVILNGLSRLTGRKPPENDIKRDVNLLFKGVEQVIDATSYGAFFAGPAAVIWGYQNLLKLAGKSPEDAFPNGTWQFYVDYALREDTARHANETHGFDTLLNQHGIQLSRVDRVTTWVVTAMQVLLRYDQLLENEWRERVYTYILNEVTDKQFPKAYTRWLGRLPYGRQADAANLSYPEYRRSKFDQYIEPLLQKLTPSQKQQWQEAINQLEQEALPAYQQQMNIRSYLQPNANDEAHIDIPLEQTCIGVVHHGSYYLIPLWHAKGKLSEMTTIRAQVAAILQDELPSYPAKLQRISTIRRSTLASLLPKFNTDAQQAWDIMNYAPIIINADQRSPDQTLVNIRQAERSTGSHALTIFDTGKTFVFDQSHIYYDGAWGSALAEIMTNEALAWAQYFASLPDAQAQTEGVKVINFNWQTQDEALIEKASKIMPEASAESDQIKIRAILGLRKLFKSRSDLLQLTVNDLLVLYRAIHVVKYKPDPNLVAELQSLQTTPDLQKAAQKALDSLDDYTLPAILIPVDATRAQPSERLYPMSFDVPLRDLNLVDLHTQTLDALEAYQQDSGDRTENYEEFNKLQRDYLGTLAGFGNVLSHAKERAISGEDASSGTIRMLAHMPRPLQRLLDEIPSKIDLLNDIIKGREVFSNVGAVASTSTLTRFITAKDDNEKKTLAWGVMTDANGVMRISLRDFRPHVGLLQQQRQHDLAQRITQDYLDSYVSGLNQYVQDLRKITLSSRETRMMKGSDLNE